MSHPTDVIVPSEQATPETYLGTARAQGWINGPHCGHARLRPGPHRRPRCQRLRLQRHLEHRRPARPGGRGAGIDVEFQAKNVYLVLSSPGERPLPVQVLLDGRPISAADAGADVHGGVVTVRRQRLYTLVSLPRDEQHRLTLRFAPGVTGYAFTFG